MFMVNLRIYHTSLEHITKVFDLFEFGFVDVRSTRVWIKKVLRNCTILKKKLLGKITPRRLETINTSHFLKKASLRLTWFFVFKLISFETV